MISGFLAAIVDTLLPGETAAPAAPAPLPSGSRAGVDLGALPAAHAGSLRAIAEAAGSEAAFEAAPRALRADVLRQVERQVPAEFQALVAAVLRCYYQSDAVTAAMGWRLAPPQPGGHVLPTTDEATWARLERVRKRGRIWR